eukprot:1213872-Rhodomonas_salina.2
MDKEEQFSNGIKLSFCNVGLAPLDGDVTVGDAVWKTLTTLDKSWCLSLQGIGMLQSTILGQSAHATCLADLIDDGNLVRLDTEEHMEDCELGCEDEEFEDDKVAV